MIYAAAVVAGFLINSRVGVIIAVVGGILLGAVYTMSRSSAVSGGRERNRNRNRNR
jgi:hypothetical protein